MNPRNLPVLAGLIILTLSTIGCGGDGADLTRYRAEFSSIQEEFNNGLTRVSDRSAYDQLQESRKNRLEDLLNQIPRKTGSESLTILRARILVNLGRVTEAETLLTPLLNLDSVPPEAAMVSVLADMAQRRHENALRRFRSISENQLDAADRYNAWLYFAMVMDDPEIRGEYARKFVSSEQMPPHFSLFRANVYQQLARIDSDARRFDNAREWIDKAIQSAADPNMRKTLEAEKQRMAMLGSPPPGLIAEQWLNSSPINPAQLKGKVVLIDFWAPWCNPCRVVIPELKKMYGEMKEEGLEIIGLTRLHGFYRDDMHNRGRVDAREESNLIKEFVGRHKINYPVAVSREGQSFDAYRISGIPTMVIIDRRGRIAAIKVGAGHPESLRQTIQTLLEERP